jgi:integrase
MFSWALEHEVVKFNPASGISKPAQENPKDRCLSIDEIANLWDSLTQKGSIPKAVQVTLKLILLTGLRPGEVIAATWDQVNNDWLGLPGSSTKNKAPHRTYLSSFSLQLVGEKNDGLIVDRDGIERLEVYTLSAWVRSNNYFGLSPWSPHDLRRTCATNLAEMGTAPHIISRILNHKPTGITAQVYDRYLYSNEIQTALEAWGRKLESLTTEKQQNNVIPFIKSS